MGKLSQSSIIDQINDLIDPRLLIEKINYAPDKVQIIGNNLKCFCPLHKEKAFRSLIIDLRKKNFRCSVKGCSGFEGGSLVDFYALHTDQPTLKAAFSLAKLLELPIDQEMIESLSQSFLEEARQAFLEREIEKAQNFASQSLDVAPENLDARFLLAQILEELGNHVGAIKEYQLAADGYASLDPPQSEKAIEIYEQYVLSKEPRNEEFLSKSALIYIQLGNNENAIQNYLLIIGENEERGNLEKNLDYFNKILELDPSRYDIRLRFASLHETLGNLPQAVNEYLSLAAGCREQGDPSKALTHLEHIKSLVPENFTCRERIAEIYFETGETEKAEKEYLELGEVAIEQDEFETAERYYKTLIDKQPDSVIIHEGLINLFEKMENRTALSRECSLLAEILEKKGDLERAAQTLTRAKYHNPKDVNLREKLVQILSRNEKKDEAVEENLQLADLYHEIGDAENVDRCLDQVKKMVKGLGEKEITINTQVAARYHQYGNTDHARSEFLELADRLQDDEEYEASLSVCSEAIKIDEEYIPYYERRLTALRELGRKDEAIEVHKNLYQIHIDAKNLDKAEQILREGLTLDEDNIFIHRKLVDLYLSSDNTSNALSTLTSLSQIYYDKNSLEEGIETASKILELSPEAVATRERLAYLYKEKQVFDQAMEEYSKAAEYYITVNQPTAAVHDLKAILEIDEENRDALRRISELLLEHENFEAAHPYLIKGLELIKDGMGSTDEVVQEYQRILELKEGQNELKEEFAAYLKSVSHMPEALIQLRGLADYYKEEKNYAKTAGILEDILECTQQLASTDGGDAIPDQIQTLHAVKAELADMYKALDIPQEAMSYYAQAAAGFREAGPDGETETIDIYRKILEIDPNEESIREELADLLAKHDKVNEAILHFAFLAEGRSQQGREAENIPVYIRLLSMMEAPAGEIDIPKGAEPDTIREKLAAVYEAEGEAESAVEQLLILADSHEKNNDLPTAISKCRHARELMPAREEPRTILIRLYESSGDEASLKKEHIALGELYLDQSEPDSAEIHFRKAQELDPEDISIGEQLAKLHEARDNYEDACLEYRNLSTLYEKAGELEKAVGVLRRVKSLDPSDRKSMESIAHMLLKLEDISGALKEYHDLARTCFEAGGGKVIKEGMAHLKKIAEIAPDNFDMRMASARLLFSQDKTKQGVREIRDLADILLEADRFDEAIKAVDFSLEQDENNLDLRERKIKALSEKGAAQEANIESLAASEIAYSSDKFDRADRYLQAIIETEPNHIEALSLSVECNLKLDNKERAIELLIHIMNLREKKEQTGKAIEAAGRILELDPERVGVMKQLARLYLKEGDENQAVDTFDRIADSYISSGNYSEACTHLSRILEYRTKSIPTIRKLAFLIYENENLVKARPHFKKLLDLCVGEYKPKDTIKEFKNILKIDPNNAQLYLDYARFLREQDDIKGAQNQYTRAADLLLEDKKTHSQAIDVLARLLELNPEDTSLLGKIAGLCVEQERPGEAFDYYQKCAEVHLQNSQVDEAIGQMLAALEIRPEEPDLLSRVAGLYESSGQIVEAIQKYTELADLHLKRKPEELGGSENVDVYLKILALDDTLKPVRHKLAKLYEKQQMLDQATLHYLILGEQFEKEKERNKALTVYQHIKKINPAEEDNRNRMVEIFIESDRGDQAKAELSELAQLSLSDPTQSEKCEKYLLRMKELDPDDISIGEKLARIYEERGDVDTAIEQYLYVADLYIEKQEFPKSLETLSRAKKLAPPNTSVLEKLLFCYKASGEKKLFLDEGISLANLYLQDNRTEEAIRVCKAISSFDTGDVETRLKVADLLVDNALKDEALEEYSELSKHLVEKGQFDQANRVCDIGLKLASEHIPLLQFKIDVLLGKKDQAGAADLYLKLADIHKSRENPKAQEQSYRKAIEILPDHVPAFESLISLLTNLGRTDEAVEQLIHLADIHQERQNPDGAIQCHQEILILQPENNPVRENLARLYQSQGQNQPACQEYTTLAEMSEDEEDFESARGYYEKVLEIDEKNVDTLRAVIRISGKQDNIKDFIHYSQTLASHFEGMEAFADALTLYQGIVEIDETCLSAYQKLASCHEAVGNIEEAVSSYKKLSELYQKQGAYQAAISQLEAVERLLPDDAENLKSLGSLHLKAENRQEATGYFARAVDISRALGNLEEAVILARQLINVDKERPASHQVYAEILEESGQPGEAAKVYSFMADLLGKKDKIEEAVNALASALRLSPDLLKEREKYAKYLQHLGRSVDALQEYLQLTDLYFERKEFKKAVTSARHVFSLEENNAEAHRKLKSIYIALDEKENALNEIQWIAHFSIENDSLKEAEEILLEGLQIDDTRIELRDLLVELYSKTGESEKATEQLLKITEQALFKGNLDKAIDSLEQARILTGENVEIRKNLAELYFRNDQPEKAREEIFTVATLYLEQGLVDKARQICDSLLQQAPKNCELREKVGDLFREQEVPELASRQYLEISSLKKTEGLYEEVLRFADKALEMNPKCLEAHENRVESLLRLGKRDMAYKEFHVLSELYTELGFFEKARDAYKEMVELAPEDPLPRQKLVTIYSLTNNRDEQVATLRGLAEILMKSDRTEEAVDAYQSILEIRPDDTRARIRYIDLYSRIGPEMELIDDYVKLIDIYIKHGAMAEATRIFEKLTQIIPEDPDIKERFIRFLMQNKEKTRAFEEMLALSSIYVNAGQLKKASRILGEAVSIAPNDPDVHLKLAETYVLMNAKGMAVQELEKAAELFDKAGNSDKYLEILDRVIVIDPQNLDVHQSLIERLKHEGRQEEAIGHLKTLADLYIERGLLDLAENVYRDILKINAENIEIWNFLIQTHLQIGLEEDLVDDYKTLGDLYLGKGMLKEALEQYRKVIEADPQNIEIRRKYIDTYMQIGLENDLIDDYLELADALVQKEKIDEAIRLYSHVTSLDPDNKKARLKLTETRSRFKTKAPEEQVEEEEAPEPASEEEKPEEKTSEIDYSEESYQEAVENYKSILSVNPSNANVRCKLAEIYLQLEQVEEAVGELDKASETFIFKGELDKGIALCEKIIELDPSLAAIRDRLSKAILQRDSFKAIESAISAFTDTYTPDEKENNTTEGEVDTV